MKIQGSVSLITGGCQGFGRAFSKELLKRGGRVSMVDIDDTIGQEVSAEFKDQFGNENVHFIHCDVTDSPSLEGAFKETISKFGRLDILCNNAGAIMQSWEKLVQLNLASVIHGTFLGIEHLKASNNGEGGLIVNIASMAGPNILKAHVIELFSSRQELWLRKAANVKEENLMAFQGLRPFRDAPVYSATKFGVVGFSQCLKAFCLPVIQIAHETLRDAKQGKAGKAASAGGPNILKAHVIELFSSRQELWLRKAANVKEENLMAFQGLRPFRDAPVYSATKFGVVGFSQCLKEANVKDKIRVNCLCPSFSPTTMVEKGLAARPEMRPFVEKIGIVPIEDVAKGFLELVNDDSRDGEVLSVTVQGLAYVTGRHDIVPIEPKL